MTFSKQIVITNIAVVKQKKHFPEYFQEVFFLIYLNKITTLLHYHLLSINDIYTLRQNSNLSDSLVILSILHNQS